MITFIDEKGTEHSALVAYSVTNAVNGELSVKGTIYTNDKVLHGIGRGWRFRLDDEYFRITYAKPNDTGRQIEVEFDAVHQFFYDMSKSMVYTTLNGSKPFETYLQAIFSNSGYTYNLETTVGSIRKENFGNKSRLALFNDIIKAAGLEFSVRGHVIRILKRVGTDLSTIVRKDFNMNELKIEKDINSFVTYQRGLGAWKDDEDHSKGRYETSYESPLSAIYGRIEADPVVDERYKDTGKLLERLKENVDKSYKVSVEIDMEDLSQAGYRISHPNPGDYIMAINETLGFRQKVRIVSFTSEYDVGGNLISRKVVCNDIGTVQRATSEISHLSRTLTDSIEGSERALKTATRALVSADGKNTNYFGDVKPLDVPKGTLRKGDRLFLTVGDKKQLYFWNGAEWELEPTEFDHEKFDMEFNRKSQEIKKVIQENRQKAEEALRNAGASSLLAQEAKRIGLDSVAKLEEFKKQATSAQAALSGDLDALKQTIAKDIRPKQAQAEAEIAKQVEALIQTKNELASVKSAQATYEETTTRRLAELTNLANGKASKSELTQTAEELASKIASVQASGRNLFLNSLFKKDISKTGIWTTSTYEATIDSTDKYLGHNALKIIGQNPAGRDGGNPKITYPAFGQFGKVISGSTTNQDVTISFYAKASKSGIMLRSRLGNINYKTGNVILSTEIKRYVVYIPKGWTNESKLTTNEWLFNFNQEGTVWIWMPKFEISDVDTSYSEAPEDIEGQISAVESNFKQRADALDAGVSRLTEGLRTKADISALNVTAENIRQSVKSLETSTQNKLNQMLSLAEFEVRAGSIRQEILNATKDKADKTLVIAEAGKIREEFSNLRVGGRNLIRNYDWNGLLPLNIIGSGWKFERIADENAKSGYSLKATCTQGGAGGFYKHLFDLRANEFQSKDMTWSWDMKSSRSITFNVMGFEAGGLKRNVPVSTEWTRITNTFKVAFKELFSCVFYSFEWKVGDVVYIRDPQLEEGTIATTPRPAPEDGKDEVLAARTEFQKTAEGLSTKMSAVESYVGQDGQRQETLRRYTREESARQATAVRELVARDYVGKSTYQEDVRGIERRFEAITNPQNGTIATQIANYKQSVDGRFAGIISQIATKANQTDFQRVQETSKLYERIIGSNENDISNKVARMAMTNQLFHVEVGKYANVGGPNMLRNSRADDGLKYWTEADGRLGFTAHQFYFNGQKKMFELRSGALVKSPRFIIKRNADYVLNILGFDTNSKYFKIYFCKRKKGVTSDFEEKQLVFDGRPPQVDGSVFNSSKAIKKSFQFNVGDFDDGYLQFEYERNNSNKWGGLFMTELDFYEGSNDRLWQPAPEDAVADANAKLEATQTKMTQLAGSWAVQNINSAGDLISGINLGANGHNRLDGKLTHITGETLIDKAVIKSAMIDKLKTANFEAGSVTTIVLDAEAVTAEKLKVDQAFFNKLVANEAYLSQLFAKQAFINRVQSVAIDASQVRSGILSGDRIYGGTIRGASIYGGTLTGHTQIQLGSYGSFDTVNGGLQINVPRDYNAKDGLGVQFIGSYGRGENVPYGLFIYKDSDFTTGGYASQSDEFLLTVEGYIKANGIGWMRTGKGSVNGQTTATIGLWNSENVSLDFGGSGNDIYYSYNGTAYSLWSVVNQHFSDRRLKENIVDCNHKALDYIQQFQFKEYDWKKQEDRPQQAHTKIGLIAQEVQEIDPTLVYENGDTLNLDNLRLTTIALKAIQELSQRIETLERKIA